MHVPNRFIDDSPPESDDIDTMCIICKQRDSPIACTMVFWVDCDDCGKWVAVKTCEYKTFSSLPLNAASHNAESSTSRFTFDIFSSSLNFLGFRY